MDKKEAAGDLEQMFSVGAVLRAHLVKTPALLIHGMRALGRP